MKSFFARCSLFAAVALLMMTCPLRGQNTETKNENAPKKMQLTGTVAKEKLVRVSGADVQHQVLLLQIRDAGEVPVDLGEFQDVKSLKISTGTAITVYGTMLRVGDKDVLFADDVEAAGKKTHVKRIVPGRISTITGRIIAKSELKVQETGGIGARNVIVAVKTKDNASIVADLGSVQELDTVRLAIGQQIDMQGVIAGIGGHMVMLVNQFTTQGKTVKIMRSWTGDALGTK